MKILCENIVIIIHSCLASSHQSSRHDAVDTNINLKIVKCQHARCSVCTVSNGYSIVRSYFPAKRCASNHSRWANFCSTRISCAMFSTLIAVNFRSNTRSSERVTSSSLPVTWFHHDAFSSTCPPLPLSPILNLYLSVVWWIICHSSSHRNARSIGNVLSNSIRCEYWICYRVLIDNICAHVRTRCMAEERATTLSMLWLTKYKNATE